MKTFDKCDKITCRTWLSPENGEIYQIKWRKIREKSKNIWVNVGLHPQSGVVCITVERTCRLANNLCLFCGGTGHSVKDCTKATSSSAKAKARTAKVADSKTDTSSDSKK